MRIAQFDIKGHAVVQDMHVEVRDHLIIVGANDVGKTSVLRLLNLLLGATTPQLYQWLTPADIRAGAERLEISARLKDLGEEELARFPFATTVEAGEPYYLTIQLEARVSEDDPDSVLVERYLPDSGNRRSLTRDQLAAIGWRYLPANRSAGTDFMEGRNSPLRAMLDTAGVGEDLTGLSDLLGQFNRVLEKNEALRQLRKQLAAHLSRSVPRGYTEEELAIRTSADPTQAPLQDVTVFLKDGEQLKGLTEQSDGMRQLMALTFFDLAQQGANIVAVDEPEIHLHPSSQRTVAGLLADSLRQRLVVTHSAYVVQRFEPKHVLVVDPERRGKQLKTTAFSAVEKEMANWWSPHLLENLTARKVLLVEGVADRIIVEAAARAVGISLDRIGVSVLALDGADKLAHVLKVIGPAGFDLPLCGMCDEDREESWKTALGLRRKTDLPGRGFFVARRDLEQEYVQAFGATESIRVLVDAGVANQAGILQATEAKDVTAVTAEALGRFLSSKDNRKVPAARALAPLLTPEVVDKSPALKGLLDHVRAAM